MNIVFACKFAIHTYLVLAEALAPQGVADPVEISRAKLVCDAVPAVDL